MRKLNSNPLNYSLLNPNKFQIIWQDKHESNYDSLRLRILCPCAECRGGHGGKIGDNTKHIKGDIKIKEYGEVGRYALSFLFSDMHKAGIYTWEYLRNICPCSKCNENPKENL